MTEQTPIAENAEFKVRSRLAQHLQEPHSPIRLKASDLVRLLEEVDQMRGQLASATAAHVEHTAAMQAQIDELRAAHTAAVDAGAAEIQRAAQATAHAAFLGAALDKTNARHVATRAELERKLRRLQRQLRTPAKAAA